MLALEVMLNFKEDSLQIKGNRIINSKILKFKQPYNLEITAAPGLEICIAVYSQEKLYNSLKNFFYGTQVRLIDSDDHTALIIPGEYHLNIKRD